MTNSKELFTEVVRQITLPESKDEIESIAYLLLEKKGKQTKTDVLAEKKTTLTWAEIEPIIQRINKHEPIQYILGESDFYGRIFKVTPATLIPRPETELLIHEIKKIYSSTPGLNILDVGTGSGCIAITLAQELKTPHITAIDVSNPALEVAKYNAVNLKANVHFIEGDVLTGKIQGLYDIVVSNPPYISQQEKKSLSPNVVNYEPHLALFPQGNDPLLFYRVITQKAQQALTPRGSIWFEINEHFGKDIADILKENGFENVTLIKDWSGKERVAWGKRL